MSLKYLLSVAIVVTSLTGLNEARSALICSGINADNSGNLDAAPAIQACINQLPSGGRLQLPAGTYRIDQVVQLTKPLTITTQGLLGSLAICKDDASLNCAKLISGPSFAGEALIKGTTSATDYIIDHLVFDGNRAARLIHVSNWSSRCADPIAPAGRNLLLLRADRSRIQYSFFKNAVCGAAVGIASVSSPSMVVTANIFSDNGDHGTPGLWADGLTIGFVQDSQITNNYFYNNSDVSLILGEGIRTAITGNVFVQTWQATFASLMLTNWNAGGIGWADFRGAVIQGNSFYVGDLSDIAIQVGVMPWAGNAVCGNIRTMGGTVSSNTISSNKQHINVACGGIPEALVVIENNSHSRVGDLKPAGYNRSVLTSYINVQQPNFYSFAQVSSSFQVTNNVWDLAY